MEWHKTVGLEAGGIVDLSFSFYLALSWNMAGEYQLFKFPLALPDSSVLAWDFPMVENNGGQIHGRHLRGCDEYGTIFEWYGESGGQLKYYPLAENATWKSQFFSLESLPEEWDKKHGILTKAKDYFPRAWERAA